MAYKVHFWSISGKLTHTNDKNTSKYVAKGFSWGSESILELGRDQNDEMLPRVNPSRSTSGRTLGAVRSAKMSQNYQKKSLRAYFDVIS